MSTLSVAIIMKNEEDVVFRCLTCLSKFADEIVIIDTGSTDKTKEIATTFPKVRLFDSELFNKDTLLSDFEFGKAKNEAIRKCTKDWVCWFDADDMMDDEYAAKLMEIVNNETRTCLYSFRIVYGTMVFEHCRLFKNHAGILFDEDHACHEYLNTQGNPLIVRNDILIQHLPGKKHVSSADRNLAILEKDYFVRNRQDRRTIFYLANSYRESGKLEQAVDFYGKYLTTSEWKEERYFARYYAAQCLFRLNRIDDARNEIFMSMAEDSRFAESLCFMGDVCFAQKDYERSLLWFKMALQTPFPNDAKLFANRYSYSEYPTKRIGDCMNAIGEPKIEGDSSSTVKCSVPQKASNKRTLKFSLPDDRSLAMLAVAALSNCVSHDNADIEICTKDDWQKQLVAKFDSLRVGMGDGAKLSLPISLKGKHAVHWYIRSAGFVGVHVEPVRISNASIQKGCLVLVDGKLPKCILEAICTSGYSFVLLDDDWDLSKALENFNKSFAFIGCNGWMQQLSKWVKVPSLVVWNGKSATEFGWPDQVNIAEDELTPEKVITFIREHNQ